MNSKSAAHEIVQNQTQKGSIFGSRVAAMPFDGDLVMGKEFGLTTAIPLIVHLAQLS